MKYKSVPGNIRNSDSLRAAVPGIESQLGRDFKQPSRPPKGPTQPFLYNG